MSKIVYRRARAPRPAPKAIEIQLHTLQAAPERPRLHLGQVVTPLLGSSTLIVYALLQQSTTFLYMGLAAMALSALSPVVMTWFNRRSHARAVRTTLARYDRYLARVETQVSSELDERRTSCAKQNLTIETLLAEAASGEIWQRRPGDDDFLQLVLGTGWIDSELAVRAEPADPLSDAPDKFAGRVDELVSRASRLSGSPILLSAHGGGVLAIDASSPAEGLAVSRSLVAQLVTAHGPDDLELSLSCSVENISQWQWAAQVPHCRGALGPRILSDPRAAITYVHSVGGILPAGSKTRRPAMCLVIDGFQIDSPLARHASMLSLFKNAKQLNVLVILRLRAGTDTPEHCSWRLDVKPAGGSLLDFATGTETPIEKVSSCSASEIARLATELGTFSLAEPDRAADIVSPDADAKALTPERLLDVLGVAEEMQQERVWGKELDADLAVPLGWGEDSRLVTLSLAEAAKGGSGPHGILLGATGAGKSELLRSLACALAFKNSPEQLNLLFIDFKAGASFDVLSQLPHCAGIVTNVEDDLSLVDRVKASISRELGDRKRTLGDTRLLGETAADLQSLRDYNQLRARKPLLPPLPTLVIIIDEFGELLTARPDFATTLIEVVRTGRYVGVHLLLASQRLEAHMLRGLETQLGFRISLRTFTVEESRLAIGSPLAAELPREPGHGYVNEMGKLRRFTGLRVSQPPRGASIKPPFNPAFMTSAFSTSPSDIRDICRWLSHGKTKTGRLWLDPLPDASQGEPLMPDDRRMTPDATARRVPLALVDDPRRRQQAPLYVDFRPEGGRNTLVVGAQQSGKSNAVRHVVAATARVHPSSSIVFSVVGGDDASRSLSNFGNVATSVSMHNASGVRRAIESLMAELHTREVASQAVGTLGSAVLVIDGYGQFRERYPELVDAITHLLTQGPDRAVFGLFTAVQWNDLRQAQIELFPTRLELRLNEPAMSQMGRTFAQAIRADRPGRGVVDGGLFAQVPFVEPSWLEACRTEGGKKFPKDSSAILRPLSSLPIADWNVAARATNEGLLLGVADGTLRGIRYSVSDGSHFVLAGDSGTGRSRLLARMLGDISAAAQDSQIYLVDYRGTCVGLAREHVSHLIVDGGKLRALLTDPLILNSDELEHLPGENLIGELRRRLEVRSSALEDGRTLPRFAPLVLAIDDYDRVVGGAGQLFHGLKSWLKWARELCLSVVCALSASDVSLIGDPFLQALKNDSNVNVLEFATREPAALTERKGRSSALAGSVYLVRRDVSPQLLQVLPPLLVSPWVSGDGASSSLETRSSRDNRPFGFGFGPKSFEIS